MSDSEYHRYLAEAEARRERNRRLPYALRRARALCEDASESIYNAQTMVRHRRNWYEITGYKWRLRKALQAALHKQARNAAKATKGALFYLFAAAAQCRPAAQPQPQL